MPTPTQYIDRIEFIDRSIKLRIEGLTHADSMKQLPFPGNCMNWNIGHIMVYRDEYRNLYHHLHMEIPAFLMQKTHDPAGMTFYYLIYFRRTYGDQEYEAFAICINPLLSAI